MAHPGLKVGITGGASAGHVVPALAVAAELRRMGYEDLVFFGRAGSIEEELAVRGGLRFVPMTAAGLRRYRSLHNLTMPFSVVKGVGQAWRAMHRERPHVVFSKGSYVAVPVGIGAWLAGIPLVIHESDQSLGLANRILARFAKRIMLTAEHDGKARSSGKYEITGLPLRDDLVDGQPDRLRQSLGIAPEALVLLIFCGSSGSVRINAAIRAELRSLLKRYAVVHVTGRGNIDEGLVGVPNYYQFEYLHDNMVDALWLADVVVGRAGATTLAELSALKKPAIVVPLPTSVSRGDQIINAEVFAQGDERLVVHDDEDMRANLANACLRLSEHRNSSRVPPNPSVIRSAARTVAERVVAIGQIRDRH
jgi:UDP-N-acetylglucosamine--N-acetylmuramyl-(pentapeptide) pyrophosphoryl-undecaprenol N-acetylglucosamine transferase